MVVYLLRHGIAEDRAASGLDRDRALTGEGYTRLNMVLQVAKQAGVRPDVVLSSPYRRARETAETARAVLGTQLATVETAAFTPDASPRAAWDEIRVWNSEDEVLVATHEPLVSSLLSHLLGVSEIVHDFKKAGLAKIQMTRTGPQPAGTLIWLLTPALAHAVSTNG